MPASARLTTTCATCRSQSALEVIQTIEGGRLTWREIFSCACGHGFQAAGAGLPTAAQRRALLSQDGAGEVWVDSPVGERVLGVLSHFTAAPVAELRRRVKRLPARVFEGTRIEAEFVGEALRLVGVEGRVVVRLPKPPTATPPRLPRGLRKKQ